MRLAVLLIVCLLTPMLLAEDDSCDLSMGEESGLIFMICPGDKILVIDSDQEPGDSAARCHEDQTCLGQWTTTKL